MNTATIQKIDERFLSDHAVEAAFCGAREEWVTFADTVAIHLTMVKAVAHEEPPFTTFTAYQDFYMCRAGSFIELLRIREKVHATKAPLIALLKDQGQSRRGWSVETYRKLHATEVLRRHLDALTRATRWWLKLPLDYGLEGWDGVPGMGSPGARTEEQECAAILIEAVGDPTHVSLCAPRTVRILIEGISKDHVEVCEVQ